MNPPLRTEAERIAGTLTKAQRVALTDAIDLQSLGFMTKIETGRSAKALHGAGLTWLSWAPSTLTPLGLAVREALLSQEQTDER